ncbi:MAG: hypothetical protein KKF88_00495 [Alphaproteobacteria bacterium]|nr:hypothetical protein [Alphaproteobacteria bacterium]
MKFTKTLLVATVSAASLMISSCATTLTQYSQSTVRCFALQNYIMNLDVLNISTDKSARDRDAGAYESDSSLMRSVLSNKSLGLFKTDDELRLVNEIFSLYTNFELEQVLTAGSTFRSESDVIGAVDALIKDANLDDNTKEGVRNMFIDPSTGRARSTSAVSRDYGVRIMNEVYGGSCHRSHEQREIKDAVTIEVDEAIRDEVAKQIEDDGDGDDVCTDLEGCL